MIANRYNISLFNIFVNSFLKIFLNFFKKFIVYSTNTVITVFKKYKIFFKIYNNKKSELNY